MGLIEVMKNGRLTALHCQKKALVEKKLRLKHKPASQTYFIFLMPHFALSLEFFTRTQDISFDVTGLVRRKSVVSLLNGIFTEQLDIEGKLKIKILQNKLRCFHC